MNRYKAFLAHLGISATIVGTFLVLTFFVWYPSPLFTIEGTKLPLQILFVVDIVLGPLLTLIIFKSGKKGLKFDLTMIALVQITAFIYGASVVFTERPAFVAFAVDRFTIIPRSEVVGDQLDKIDHTKITINKFGPTYVYAEPPSDPKEAERVMFEALEGKGDIDRRPEYYRELKTNISKNFNKGIDLNHYAKKIIEAGPIIDDFFKNKKTTRDAVAAFPLSGKLHDMVIVIDKGSKEILGTIDINPWITVQK
jgi:hypothetical protein